MERVDYCVKMMQGWIGVRWRGGSDERPTQRWEMTGIDLRGVGFKRWLQDGKVGEGMQGTARLVLGSSPKRSLRATAMVAMWGMMTREVRLREEMVRPKECVGG
ncbi:hypothetical protein MRB53_030805 [Persea americana]|uniref:Uncharacterized protein n=1 Tax=Persea americana TaxID=3435 RepID=A0ACC2KMC6_PERAE|nr:hypothetical protein MRB53_030805 [Persea americana]